MGKDRTWQIAKGYRMTKSPQNPKPACEYYNEKCGMTNIESLRKESGCRSQRLDACCYECSNLRTCSLRCRIKQGMKDNISQKKSERQIASIQGLPAGLVGGIIGAILAAGLLRIVTQFAGEFSFFFLILCGGIGGLGFGMPTIGNKKLRGGVGVFFGVLAMLLGYYFIYTMPVDIGYVSISAAEIVSFPEFLTGFLSMWDYLFFVIGMVAAYFGGVGSLKLD